MSTDYALPPDLPPDRSLSRVDVAKLRLALSSALDALNDTPKFEHETAKRRVLSAIMLLGEKA